MAKSKRERESAAVAWHALKAIASKEATRTRDDLTPEYQYEFALAIAGMSVGDKVSYLMKGSITVAEDGTSHESPSAAALLAAVLVIVGPTTRRKIANELRTTVGGELALGRSEDAQKILTALRKAKTKRGSVTCQYERET